MVMASSAYLLIAAEKTLPYHVRPEVLRFTALHCVSDFYFQL